MTYFEPTFSLLSQDDKKYSLQALRHKDVWGSGCEVTTSEV
jgi:hypothetical protein